MGNRALTAGEITLLQSVFGSALNTSTPRIYDETHNLLQGDDEIVAPNGNVYYPGNPPGSTFYLSDISGGTWAQKAKLVHEMTHVLQDQQGINVMWTRMNQGPKYNYEAIFNGTPFHKLPIEAQAEFMEDYFLKSNGQPIDPVKADGTVGNHTFEEYEEVLPLDFPLLAPAETERELDAISPEGGDSDAEDMDSFRDDVEGLIESAENTVSPLVLDLDGDGIELTNLNSVDAVYWDVDNDGFAEASAWVGANDGLLAIDLNEDGKINDHTELFGDQTGYTNGFSALASYDENHDGIVDGSDSVWTDLIVWQDANSDGISQATELHTLADLDILSINVSPSTVSQTISGNPVTLSSSYTYDTGSGTATRTIVDAWFRYSDLNTVYDEEYVFDDRAFYLPDARGSGILPAIHAAISLDNDEQDSGSLISLMMDFAALELDDVFTDENTALDDVRDILFRWAGVDGVSPTSRGPNIDARELEFLEKLTGESFRQQGFYEDPYYFAAQELKEAFNIALNNFAARLITQAAGAALFEGDWHYDISTDSFVGVTGLNLGTLGDLETLAGTQTNKDVFWQNVVRVIDNAIGVDNLDSGDETALDDAIYDSDNTLSLAIIESSLEWDNGTITTWTGQTSGADTYTGGSGQDSISGSYGNDTLNGGLGADTIFGESDHDTMDGQGGDDLVQGGLGNDTYKYTAGQGWDTFEEYGSDTGDKILFASGIAPGDLTLTRVSNNDLLIEVASGAGGGRILVRNQFNTSTQIETLEFAGGGAAITLNVLDWTLHGTDQNDTLYGVWSGKGGDGEDTIYGGDGDDVIYAYAPNETDSDANWLYGEAGADTLYGGSGVDTLSGGDGNDTLSGGTGSDIYIYNTGHDIFREGVSGTDEIQLASGIVAGDLDYYRQGNHLVIEVDGEGSITIDSFFHSSAYRIETLRFADTSTIDLSALYYGTSGNDSLLGSSGADIMFGFGGNDTITGYAGADTLYGGEGNDTVYGGDGNDIYVYDSGDDTYAEGTASTDEVRLPEGITSGDILYYRQGSYDLVIQVDGAGTIRLDDFYYSTAYRIETLRFADNSTVDLTALSVPLYYGTSGNDSISGTNGVNDTIYGFGGSDSLYGYSGNDILYGGDGNDSLYAYGAGNDYYDGEAGNDYMEDTYGGDDVYVYSGGLDGAYDQTGADILRLTGSTTINDLSFSDLGSHHKITINASVDEITLYWVDYNSSYVVETIEFADGFTTTLSNWATWNTGTASGETLNGGSGNDTIVGKAGADTLNGNNGNDAIHGGADADSLYGNAGTDLLHGGTGADSLYGGDGLDTLFGGAGADTFFFDTNAFNNIDVVKDFAPGDNDALDIADILVGYDPMTDVIADFVTFSNSGSDSQMFVDRDGTAGTYSSVQIALIKGLTDLDADELLTANQLIAV